MPSTSLQPVTFVSFEKVVNLLQVNRMAAPTQAETGTHCFSFDLSRPQLGLTFKKQKKVGRMRVDLGYRPLDLQSDLGQNIFACFTVCI